MYNDQDRPPWLRNLRPPRPESEPEPEPYVPSPVVPEPTFEPDVTEAPPRTRGGITRQQMLLLALLLWGNVGILGCLCLLATGTVLP
jgi:hypothetical protein